MSQVTFRFYADLNDLLPARLRQRTFLYPLTGPVSVKHAIEAMGIPHTEVDLIIANGRPVDFSYLMQPNDRLAVYPPFASTGLSSEPPLRPPISSPPRFIVDNHLGQLATYLRLLGFDTLYRNDYDDEDLAQISHQEGRLLLTRDRRLLMRKIVDHGYCLRTREPHQQLKAVLHRFQLHGSINPWRRCLRCNGLLRPVAKEVIVDRLEPKTKKYYHEFHICQECEQIYWKGSHYGPLNQFIERVKRDR